VQRPTAHREVLRGRARVAAFDERAAQRRVPAGPQRAQQLKNPEVMTPPDWFGSRATGPNAAGLPDARPAAQIASNNASATPARSANSVSPNSCSDRPSLASKTASACSVVRATVSPQPFLIT
jgi:hypothetical protein